MDEPEDDEIYWRKWRAELKLLPVHVFGHELAIQHGSSKEPIFMIVEGILHGAGGWYLSGQCPALGGLKTFAVDRIEWIKTSDEVQFDSCADWLVNRAKIAVAVADDLGLIVPPESERR